ncbi:MAG: hypothetical protein SGBAC_006422 [Bacillariaceae sp.]
MTFSALPFWSKDDEIEERDDGYILLKGGRNTAAEDHPLLLHSTEVVLKLMYPGMDMRAIHTQRGYMESSPAEESSPLKVEAGSEVSTIDENEMDVEAGSEETCSVDDENKEKSNPQTNKNKNKNKGNGNGKENNSAPDTEPEDYSAYQSMERVTDLSSRLQSAILDIQRSRHRILRKNRNETPSKEANVKEQDDSDMEEEDASVSSQNKGEANEDDEMLDADADADDNTTEQDEDETDTLRLVRTLNSIRALFPHLLPILNHPKRNDKNLKIRDLEYKRRKKRAMCWILGKYVFDTTTANWCKNAQRDITTLLNKYINDVSLVETLVWDPQGGSVEFWQTQWLTEVKKRIAPKIMPPFDILLLLLSENNSNNNNNNNNNNNDNNNNNNNNNNTSTGGDIMRIAQKLDQDVFVADDTDKVTLDMRQKYGQCIHNLELKILKLLKRRYPKARLSLYGSCLSNLSIGKGSDVDLSLWIPISDTTKNHRKEITKHVYKVFHILNNLDGFEGLQPITRARVPVVKGTKLRAGNPYTPDGSIEFDICFLNDIAVVNSNLLLEYSLIDSRVRDFMLQWSDVEGHWTRSPMYAMTTVSLLLYGFFEFYSSRFPGAFCSASIRRGDLSLSRLSGKMSSFLSIEDPFELYDSWKPHDLGSHASDTGAEKIFRCLKDGEKQIRELLLGVSTDSASLWKLSDKGDVQGKDTKPTFGKSKGGKKAPVSKIEFNVPSKQGKGTKPKGNNNGNKADKQSNQMGKAKQRGNPRRRKNAPQQKRNNEKRGVPKSQEKDTTNGKQRQTQQKDRAD